MTNFLFLSSLAIISWVILCYINETKIQSESNLITESNEGVNVSCSGFYSIYSIGFFVIISVIACVEIYPRIKSFIIRYITEKFYRTYYAEISKVEPTTVDEYREDRQNLIKRIIYLEGKSAQLTRNLKSLTSSEIQALTYNGEALEYDNNYGLEIIEPKVLNNNKTNLSNNQLWPAEFLKEHNIGFKPFNINTHFNFGITEEEAERSEHLDEYDNDDDNNYETKPFVWEEYLKMRKYAYEKPVSRYSEKNPTIFCTEELQNLMGLYESKFPVLRSKCTI